MSNLFDDLKIPAAGDLGAVAGLQILIAADPEGYAAKIKELTAVSAEARTTTEEANKATANLALERAQHAGAMDAMSRRQASEHEGRLREAQNILAAAEALNREATEKLQKAHAVEHATANRIADMTQRFAHSGAK
jgi:hypothetical protein